MLPGSSVEADSRTVVVTGVALALLAVGVFYLTAALLDDTPDDETSHASGTYTSGIWHWPTDRDHELDEGRSVSHESD